MPRNRSHGNDDPHRNPHGECPDVVQPGAHVQSKNIKQGGQRERDQREHDVVGRIVREATPVVTNIERIAGGEVKHGREVRQVADPICPGSVETGEVAERVLCPDVNPSFLGITRGKLNDREREWRVEKKKGADPDDDRAGAGSSGSGDPAQADARDHVEQHQVAEAHDRLGLVGALGFGDWTGHQVIAGMRITI